MPKVKFGVSAKEAAAAKGGVPEAPKQGVYAAKVLSIDWEEPNNKDPRFHVIFELVKTKDPLVGGYKIHTYLIPGSDTAAWKWHQFLIAIGKVTDKGGKGILDTDRPQDLPTVLLRTKNEEYEGSMRAKEAGILPHKPPKGGTADDDDDDDDDLGEDDDEVDLEEMSPTELRAYAKENDITLPKGKVAKSKLIAAIEEAMGEEDDDEEEEDDEDDEEDDDEVDLSSMTPKELREYAEEQEIELPKGKLGKDKLVEIIEEALEEGDDDDDDEEEEDDEAEDYSEWSLPDLKKELKSRDLSVAGTKAKLIKRLEESDESDPFDDEE